MLARKHRTLYNLDSDNFSIMSNCISFSIAGYFRHIPTRSRALSFSRSILLQRVSCHAIEIPVNPSKQDLAFCVLEISNYTIWNALLVMIALHILNIQTQPSEYSGRIHRITNVSQTSYLIITSSRSSRCLTAGSAIGTSTLRVSIHITNFVSKLNFSLPTLFLVQ